jgi:hypothetical protein
MAQETGGGPPVQPAYGVDTWVFVSSDIAWTGTSQAVTGITFTVQAGEQWVFEVWIDTDTGSQPPRWTWGAGGNSATIHWDVVGWSAGTIRDVTIDKASFVSSGDVGAANGRKWYPIRGSVTGGSGPCTLQLTQTAGSSVSGTIYAGTFLRYRKLA